MMTHTVTQEWTIPAAAGELVRGQTHLPAASPRAVLLLGHGFKGYKDYGFIPLLAAELAESHPFVVHRFNFSHAGIGDDPSTFQRPDLFEHDTWNRQVEDLDALMAAAHKGAIGDAPAGLPVVLLGHSRGGVSCLLAAGRRFRDGVEPAPAAVVTMSAPSRTCSFSDEQRQELLKTGSLVSPSSRTGQQLRLSKVWLTEQLESPADHDLLALCEKIRCPVLVAHGSDDPTVPSQGAVEIANAAADGQTAIIEGANHVYNTPNPADPDAEQSAQFAALSDRIATFLASNLF